MPINFVLTPEMRAENIRKMKQTRAVQLTEKYGEMMKRYREGRMFTLSNAEAGKLLGVSSSTVVRMLQWAQRTKYGIPSTGPREGGVAA